MRNELTKQSAAVEFASDPIKYFGYSHTKVHSVPFKDLEDLQLAALQYRFAGFCDTISMVGKLAEKQKIRSMTRIDDVVPMLFDHAMYKSYPPSLLENNRFDQLTRWLDKLTSHDLSGLNTSECRGISDWVKLLDDQTPLKINHSSGTSGVMSFNPISKEEYHLFGKIYPVFFFQEFGDPPADPNYLVPKVDVVSPNYRFGANAYIRGTDMQAEFVAGAEERIHTLYPGRLDSDVMYLAARIGAAKKKGSLENLKISPHLLARQKEFEQQRADMPKDIERFFEDIVRNLKGKRVFINATWKSIYDLSMTGLKRGISGVFSPDSVVVSGGGAKGLVRPDNWEDPVREFIGVERLKGGYSMSEVCAINVLCRHDHYHVAPWLIPFVLDPDTSQPLARTGTVTGRAAFYDLLANSHWGGFITGDEITIHWNCDCPCGASTAYIENNVDRYSEERGGDDKINCAAAPDAHSEAMEYLTAFESVEQA